MLNADSTILSTRVMHQSTVFILFFKLWISRNDYNIYIDWNLQVYLQSQVLQVVCEYFRHQQKMLVVV